MAQDARAQKSWPLFSSLASWRAADLPGDLIAGLTLAAIAIPEQMATARLGGFAPQIGFFAFIAGSIGFAMLGANRFLSCGADSTITPIFAGGLAADGGHRLARLSGARGRAGADGRRDADARQRLFRLGWIANLLSTPVTVGFLAGISVHILVSQLPGVLGLPLAERTDARPHRRARAASRRRPTSTRSRSASACWRSSLGSEADQRENSGRADRAGRRDASR